MKRFTVKRCDVIKKYWVYDNKFRERVIAMKLKRDAQAQADEWNAEEDKTSHIKIVNCGIDELREKVGIHLSNPDKYEVQDAIETAIKDCFSAIYIHYSNVVSLRGAA